MAVVRPSARPTGPPDAPEQERSYRLVAVPLSHRQAPFRVEPEAEPLPEHLSLKRLSPDVARRQEPRQQEAQPRETRRQEPPTRTYGLVPVGGPRPSPPPARVPEVPLSPELALVSPDLVEEARAALPEPSGHDLPLIPAAKRLRVEPARPVRRAPSAPHQRRPVPGERRPVPGERGRRRERTRPQLEFRGIQIPGSVFVTVAVAVFMTVTGLLPARDAPTLTSPAKKEKPADVRGANAAPLVAGAVYAEGDRLRLRVGEKGRRLSGTTGALPCASGGVSFRAAVAKDGSFRGRLSGRVSSATGTVIGRFGPRTTASGILRVRLPDCDSGPVLFVAGVR